MVYCAACWYVGRSLMLQPIDCEHPILVNVKSGTFILDILDPSKIPRAPKPLLTFTGEVLSHSDTPVHIPVNVNIGTEASHPCADLYRGTTIT